MTTSTDSPTPTRARLTEGLAPRVFWPAAVFIIGFVLLAVFMPATMNSALSTANEYVVNTIGWYYVLLTFAFGLMFWGVAEPLNHFAGPPPGTGGGSDADMANAALGRTFLHWGLHAWAIYIIVGLGVAYAVHRRKLPVSIRYALKSCSSPSSR